MSPESQLSSRSKFHSPTFSNYSPAASDVWALGIILINLCFGSHPWKQATLSDPTFAAYFRDQTVLLEMFPLTQEGADILYQVLEVNPNRRCSLQKLLMMVQLVEGFVEEEFEEADDMTEQVPQYHSSCEAVKKVYSEDSVCIEIEHIDYVASDFIQNSNIAYPEAKIVVNTWEELSEINPSNTKTRMESKNVLAAPPSSKIYKTALSTVKGKNTLKSDPEYSNCSTPSRSDSYTSWSSITTDPECTSPMMFIEHDYKNNSMFKNHATADFQSSNKKSINSSSLPKNDREVVEYHHNPSPRYSPWFHLYKSEYVQLTPKERQPVCRQKIRVRNSTEDGTLEDGYQFTEFEDCYDNVETMFELTSSDKVPRSDCCFCLG
ncbi:cAMP-dependent protein kinase catalytic subunit [Basidiobolus ranarum]|uniref:cAMP-dependent protein kinase catalytic subunit n=1 Tax=Basidiobolus ranarum TaxID=34480 RepID=A0ABR2VPU9_9FUNG